MPTAVANGDYNQRGCLFLDRDYFNEGEDNLHGFAAQLPPTN